MPTDTTDLSTIYTTIEEGDVFENDNRFVSVTGDNNTYPMHLFKKVNDNREDNIRVRAVVKSTYAPTSKPIYLQIWNGTTLAWDTLQSVSDKDANEKLSLDGFVLAISADYYAFGNVVAVRVYQQNDSGASVTLSIDQIKISFEPAYSSQYEPVGNQYVEIFTPVETDYTPVYPHENPQDDL